MREKYGEDNWLSSHAGTFVQDIMGLQVSSYPILTPESTVKNLDGTSPMSHTQDDAILLIKNAQSKTKEELETKENDVVDSEKENETKVLNEEENIFEESNDAISTHLNIPEPLYDPEEGTL